MMGKKKLMEIKAEVAALLARLPAPSGHAWLDKEIKAASGNRNRDVQTLEMLCAALERQADKGRKPKTGARPVPSSSRKPKPAGRN